MATLLPNVNEIRAKRKMLGLTQAKLAESAGISRASLSKLENKLTDMSYGNVKKIFDTLAQLERERIEALELEGIYLGMVHSSPIEYMEVSLPLDGVLEAMVRTRFSQFPVWKDGVAVGVVTEKIVNRTIYERGFEVAMSVLVGEVMDPPFPVLDINTPLRLVIPLLQECQGVLTSQAGEVTGIVTNFDVLTKYKLVMFEHANNQEDM
jgi:predicted transcriptional regulator